MFSSRKESTLSSLELQINKATDATLTADNWQYILDVCDSISSNPEEATKDAIRIISSRLALKDANVILRALSLLVALAENCGSRMRQEIASKTFLQDSLIKKLNDRKLHKTVKIRIVEVIEQLYSTFKLDPSLKPMTDAYLKIKNEYSQYLDPSKNHGPVKPEKQKLSKQDKLKEEEDLQRVLKLSLQEYEREQNIKLNYLNSKPLPNANLSTQQPIQQLKQQVQEANESPDAKTIATVSKVRALYNLISYEPDELSFRKGDVITVIDSVYRDWWRGSLPNGRIGIFPLNYVTPIINKSPEELQREAEAEIDILQYDSRKVDQLLSLLSANPEYINEDEITQLYNQVIPLRPQLGKFIDKYNVRKEELLVLNNQLNKEVKLYNDLMDKLISQKSVPTYQSGNSYAPYPTDNTSQFQPISANGNFRPFVFNEAAPLQNQPTSSGFGNSLYPDPPTQPSQFLNINNFPEVNNI